MGTFKYIQNDDLSIEKVYIEDNTDKENNIRVQNILIASDEAAIARIDADHVMMLADLPESEQRTACIADCDAQKVTLNASIVARQATIAALEAELLN